MKKRTAFSLLTITGTLLFTTALLSSCGADFDKRLKEEARRMTTKQCPQRVDNVTMLDSLNYDEASRTLTRYFSVTSDVVPVIRAKEATFRSSLVRELKNDASWKECKDEGINFRLVYLESGTGAKVCEVVLGEKDYK